MEPEAYPKWTEYKVKRKTYKYQTLYKNKRYELWASDDRYTLYVTANPFPPINDLIVRYISRQLADNVDAKDVLKNLPNYVMEDLL